MQPNSTRYVGFIGLGKMGGPMVENLSRSPDWDVIVYDLDLQAVQSLVGHPSWGTKLKPAAGLSDFGICDIVITMLPDSAVTNAVVLGDGDREGLVSVLSRNSTILDMGSSDPGETGKLAAKLQEKGLRLVDTPVSGSVVKARSGELTIMVGSPSDKAAEIAPILEWMGKIIIHTGEVGTAHAMKTLNNYVYSAGLIALSEALLIVRKLGLDEEVFAEILNVSSGKNFATETKLRQFMIPRTYNGGFALRLMAKDLRTADKLRRQAGINAPQMSFCTDFASRAEKSLPPGADATEVFRFLEDSQKTGLENPQKCR